MSKIYLPQEFLNKPCYVINNDFIRVYETTNQYNNIVYDVYFKNGYMIKQNRTSFNDNTNCDKINTYTSDIYYRYDIADSLVIFVILCYIFFIIPIKVFTRWFRRFKL